MPGLDPDNKYISFLRDRYPDLLQKTGEHLSISLIAILLGCLISIPLGIYLARTQKNWLHTIVFSIANLFQTIPSLALLAILLPLLGIGTRPAVIALLLYSIMPILRNTYAGFMAVDEGVLESARGMGYSRTQRLVQIQLPLALPYIMSGIRITTVYVISWTTIATLIGAGGLGDFIYSGLGLNKKELIFFGAVSAILLALIADRLLGFIENRLTRRAHTSKKEWA